MSPDALPQQIMIAHAGWDRHETAQHYFALTSVASDPAEALDLLEEVPGSRGLGPCDLTRSEAGRAAMARVVERLEGRYLVSVEDKRARFAQAIGTYVLDPLHECWDEDELAAEAKEIVEAAALQAMIESQLSSDALCLQVDLFTRLLDTRLAPTLFDGSSSAHARVFDYLRRFAWADDDRFYDRCGRRGSTRLEDGIWIEAVRSPMSHQLKSWRERHPQFVVTFAAEAWVRTISTYLFQPTIDVPLAWIEPDAPHRTEHPAQTVPDTDPLPTVAKIIAAAAVYVSNHADDPASSRLAAAISRHLFQVPEPVSDRTGTDLGAATADPAARLCAIYTKYRDDVGWGAANLWPIERRRTLAAGR